MSEASAPIPSSSEGGLVGRRLIARFIDDALLIGLSWSIIAVANHVAGRTHRFSDSGNDGSVLPGTIGGSHPGLLLATAAAILLLFLAFAGAAALNAGFSPGRAATRIRVVGIDGQAARPAAILGRELLRVTFVVLALALLLPASQAIASPVEAMTSIRHYADMLLATNLLITLLPVMIVVGAWTGIALVDPLGRAPHDRVAKTRVTSTSHPLR